MPIQPPTYHGDQAPDYRRLLIVHSRKQAIDTQLIETALIDFAPRLFVEFVLEDLHVKVFEITNPEKTVDEALSVHNERPDLFGDMTFERDMRLSVLQAVTNDRLSLRQWALAMIQVRQAWDRIDQVGGGRPPVVVAVIDSGAQANHEDFATLPVAGVRVPLGGPNFADDVGHGTMLLGTIAAVSGNNIGIAGVASNPNRPGGAGPFPSLQVLAIKFEGARNPPTALWAVLGIMEALVRGAQVINLSWHALDVSGLLFAIINTVSNFMPFVLFVAAAGNNGSNNNRRPRPLPATFPLVNVLSVMASNERDDKPDFSNYGPNVDIAAPGARIVTTSIYYLQLPPRRIFDPGYHVYSGTSAAAAHASAAAALLLAIDNWTALEIRQHLIASADRVPGLRSLCRADGRLNLRRAVCGPFIIISPGGGAYPRGSAFNVQWNLDYNSPVVNTVEISINLRAGGLVATLAVGIAADAGTFAANMPNQPRLDVVLRVRCLQKMLYTDSAPFDIV